jgi:pyrophosphatase PpaX
MKDYANYLFDADGTIIDTMGLIVRCFEYTCKRFGNVVIPVPEIQKNVGLTLRSQMELYLGPLTDERFEIISGEHMAYQLKLYPGYLRTFPGVPESLALLKQAGKKCAVVTSRRRNTLDLYLKETKLYDYFDALVSPENTQHHKPHPEPAFAALALLDAEIGDTVFVGDSNFDIDCAAAAGLDSVFVNWSSNDPAELNAKPTYCIDDMRELVVPA